MDAAEETRSALTEAFVDAQRRAVMSGEFEAATALPSDGYTSSRPGPIPAVDSHTKERAALADPTPSSSPPQLSSTETQLLRDEVKRLTEEVHRLQSTQSSNVQALAVLVEPAILKFEEEACRMRSTLLEQQEHDREIIRTLQTKWDAQSQSRGASSPNDTAAAMDPNVSTASTTTRRV